MKTNKRLLHLGLVIIAAVLLAPILRQLINTLIIEPIAFYWWGIKRGFAAIPQILYWLFLVICLGIIAVFYLLKVFATGRRRPESQNYTTGPVQSLAQSIERTEDSHYFRWLIANRLSKLTLTSLLPPGLEDTRRKSLSVIFSELDWDPPKDILRYLNSGLNDSLNNIRGSRFFMLDKSKELKLNINSVIDYIETLTE